MKNVLGAALAANVVFSTMATAQDRSALFLDLLATAPATAFQHDTPVSLEIEFGDASAALPAATWQALRGELPLLPAQAAISRMLPADMRSTFLLALNGAMRDAVGIDAIDIEAILTVTARPQRFVSARLAEGSAAGIAPVLEAAGHAREDRGAITVLSFGDDFSVNIRQRAPENLFAGPLGQAERYAIEGDRMLHSRDWATLEAALAPHMQSLLDAEPHLRPMAQALDLLDTTMGPLAYAYILLEPGQPGILVGDLLTPATQTAFVVITAADTADARSLAERATARWPSAGPALAGGRAFAELFPGDLTVEVVEGAPAALVLSVTQSRDLEDGTFMHRAQVLMIGVTQDDGFAALIAP